MASFEIENTDINFDPTGLETLDVNFEAQDLNLNLDFGISTRYGTYDYNELDNHPLINGVELIGDKSLEDLGIDTLVEAEIQEATQTYVYNQMSASAEWTITHNLDKYPSVTVVDSAGNAIMGELRYISANSLVVSFSAPFSGKAYLN